MYSWILNGVCLIIQIKIPKPQNPKTPSLNLNIKHLFINEEDTVCQRDDSSWGTLGEELACIGQKEQWDPGAPTFQTVVEEAAQRSVWLSMHRLPIWAHCPRNPGHLTVVTATHRASCTNFDLMRINETTPGIEIVVNQESHFERLRFAVVELYLNVKVRTAAEVPCFF